MENATTFWQSCLARCRHFWVTACRPWLRRRNIPYFVLLALVAFLLTTSAARRREPQLRLPARSAAAAAAEEPRITLGQTQDELAAAWAAMTERQTGQTAAAVEVATPLVFASPCRGTVALGRGWRREEPRGTWIYHRGVDIRVPAGEVVVASAPGRVLRVADGEEGGLLVELSHAEGWRTIYGRLSKVEIKPGTDLPAGGLIGRVAGDLVHFELWREQTAVEPGTVIPGLR